MVLGFRVRVGARVKVRVRVECSYIHGGVHRVRV